MKELLKKFQMSVVLFLKLALYFCIMATFFLLFSIQNFQILTLSRTMAVTMLTFVATGIILTAAYGKYDIGKRKSKPIVYSISLATIITDMVTYLQLSIMNTNENNNASFKFEFIGILLLVMFTQICLIIIFTYLGNYIFFSINEPESCLVITSSQESLKNVVRPICKFKKQYRIDYVLDYRDKRVDEYILKVDTVFAYDLPVEQRSHVVQLCYQRRKNIYFNPEMYDVVEIHSEHVMLDDLSLIGADFRDLSLEQRFFKRLLDLVLAIPACILASPIMLLSAIAIKLDDGGKVFFKQNRVTKNGKIFNVYKFRTMKEGGENYSAQENDDRITRVGKYLRKYRIDEIPQLFNIIEGSMSLVGPRPEMLKNVYQYTEDLPEFEYRLRVKAGLTGYAQISGKYNTSPKDKLLLDLMYIENYSLLKDIQLIFQTLIVFLKSEDSTEGFMQEQKKEKESTNERKD